MVRFGPCAPMTASGPHRADRRQTSIASRINASADHNSCYRPPRYYGPPVYAPPPVYYPPPDHRSPPVYYPLY